MQVEEYEGGGKKKKEGKKKKKLSTESNPGPTDERTQRPVSLALPTLSHF